VPDNLSTFNDWNTVIGVSSRIVEESGSTFSILSALTCAANQKSRLHVGHLTKTVFRKLPLSRRPQFSPGCLLAFYLVGERLGFIHRAHFLADISVPPAQFCVV
jgi:hypothetical protein